MPSDGVVRRALIRRVKHLRAKGKTQREIAETLGLSTTTVSRWLANGQPHVADANVGQTKFWVRANPLRAQFVQRALELEAEGKSIAEIANDLDVSVPTVRRYITDPTGQITARANKRYRTGVYVTKEEAEVGFNRMNVPISKRIVMRPVWKRRQRRVYGQNRLPPPTEEEKADAIKVLADEKLCEEAPALYFEAFLIFDEASVKNE